MQNNDDDKASEPALDPVERIAPVEAFLTQTGADVSHGGNRAFYKLSQDRIQMPAYEFFRDLESYFATLLHETVHCDLFPLESANLG